MKLFTGKMRLGTLCAAFVMTMASTGNAKADDAKPVIKDHRIGFVETNLRFAVYQTPDGKTECPEGINALGSRETFKALYPNGGTVADTELVREGLKIRPLDKPAQFPFHEVQSKIGLGLNLDGKIGPRDFTSPDGEKGIDNAFYRVTGCTAGFRQPDGMLAGTGRYITIIPALAFMRMMIEISGVDSLENDDSVEVTIYRSRDRSLLDATGFKVVPGGSARIDTRFGKKLIQHLHGRIENGVLITDPINDGLWPWQLEPQVPRVMRIHDMRLRLKLSTTNADGFVAGYFDVGSLYRCMTALSAFLQNFAHLDAPEFYWAIRRSADAYPDKDGAMTAISAALSVNMTQVFVIHPDAPTAKQVAAIPAPEAPSGH